MFDGGFGVEMFFMGMKLVLVLVVEGDRKVVVFFFWVYIGIKSYLGRKWGRWKMGAGE